MTHLVVVVADTLRVPSRTPGYTGRTMPFLEEQAPRGLRLDGAVASSAWTIPSHLSLLHGSDPWEMHYHGPDLRIPKATSLATMWEEAGGESVAYSANGLVAPEYGTLRGYSSFNRHAVNRTVAPKAWAWIRPLTAPTAGPADLAPPEARPPTGTPWQVGALGARTIGAATHEGFRLLTSGRGIAGGLDRFLRRRTSARPLHLFVNLMETHEPYTLRPPRGQAAGASPELFLPMMGLAPNLRLLQQHPEARPWVEAAYLRALHALDARLRDLFEVLSSRGVLHDADLLLLSDHGQALGEGGFYGHGHSLQDEVARVPCWLWSWRRGEVRRPEGPAPSEPFDHRHLHDALVQLLSRGGSADVLGGLEESRATRGPALCYWEGPAIEELGGGRRGTGPIVPVRQLRLLRGSEELLLTEGLTEGPTGEVHLTGDRRPEAPMDLWSEAQRLLSRASSSPGNAPPPAPEVVEQRLRSWGYL